MSLPMLDHDQVFGLWVIGADVIALLALRWGYGLISRHDQSSQPVDVSSPENPLRELVLHPREWRVVDEREPI